MYQLIRGKGLTFTTSMTGSITDGRLRVDFDEASQLEEAYKVFRDIIANYRYRLSDKKLPSAAATTVAAIGWQPSHVMLITAGCCDTHMKLEI